MKKDAYYFSHDANAQDDPKMMILIEQLAMEGFGIFWALIEKLRAEKDYKLPLSVTGPFAKRWGTSKEKVETVIKNYGLFIIENDYFFSLRLQNSMIEKSEKARKSISYRWNNTTKYERNTTDIRNDTIKGKKRKEKESNNSPGGATKPGMVF
jgi:alpha-galactosidase/6-phospho-beta-glucosidase family protein